MTFKLQKLISLFEITLESEEGSRGENIIIDKAYNLNL